MRKESLEFLKDLIAAPSPSGFETPAQAIVRDHMKQFADEVKTDVHGNVVGVLNPGGKPKVMLAGHVDQIGLMIKHITDDGYLYFGEIGGFDPLTLVGQPVTVIGRRREIPGVLGRKPIHLIDAEDRGKKIKSSDLWIDIGAVDKKDAAKMVEVGDIAVLASPFRLLANNCFSAPGLDDKVGAFAVTETLRLLSRKKITCCVCAVSTVQEEVGLRGATTSTFHVDPDVGIAVDVTFATDCPDVEKKKVGEIALGKGPVVARGANINPIVGKLVESTARKAKIPFQISASPGRTGTDTWMMQISRGGVATALVSIPNRYMHTPVEVCNLNDCDAVARLMAGTCEALSPSMDFRPL